MKYEHVTQRSDSEFKRLTGVTKPLFNKMLAVLVEAESKKTDQADPTHLIWQINYRSP